MNDEAITELDQSDPVIAKIRGGFVNEANHFMKDCLFFRQGNQLMIDTTIRGIELVQLLQKAFPEASIGRSGERGMQETHIFTYDLLATLPQEKMRAVLDNARRMAVDPLTDLPEVPAKTNAHRLRNGDSRSRVSHR